MDRICMFVIPLLSILTMSSKSYSQDEFPALKGPYLGQTLRYPHEIFIENKKMS
jgi:hypothetical protein